jgi:CDP-diglyceride synthetase
VHLVFDILTGIGVAAAVGIRPFLAALVVGALAAANVEIHFNGTTYSFLQRWPFLLALVVLAFLATLLERRIGGDRGLRSPEAIALALCSLALGALLFAASLSARGTEHYVAWPGWIGGVLCAAVGLFATRPLFTRARARLDAQAASAVTLYAEAAAVVLAALSVVAPPAGLVALVALVWLWYAGRRREGQKYEGLRILR